MPLPTGELLRSRGLIPQSKCIRCGESESVSHLLFSCPFVQQIWKLAPFRDQINPLLFLDFAGGLSASKLMVCLPPTGVDARTLFAWICWSIWTSRNNAIFNRRFFSDEDILFKAIREAREWYMTQETSSPPNQKTQNLQSLPRSPVDPELILCAVDAAWRADLRSAGFGWVFHFQDKTIAGEGSSAQCFVASALEAEGLAIIEALKHAKRRGIEKLAMSSDSSQLIQALNSNFHPKVIYGIIQDIQILSKSFRYVSFTLIPRSANVYADRLAKYSLNSLSVELTLI